MTATSALPVIGFAGMTHLGLSSAVAAAEKGFETLCFDLDPELIGRLQAGNLPVSEPDLARLQSKNTARLSYSSEGGGLGRVDVLYLALDVPTDDRGRSDLEGLEAIIAAVDPHLRPDAVMVVLSQVPPGFTRGHLRAGRILYYQVETLIFGRAIERALCPERYIVGCADPQAPLPPAYQSFLAAHACPILPIRFESAELTKISINLCLVASISTANTLSELCERIGADWSEMVPALKLDKRIGAHAYLTPGLGLAGGNLERDLATVIRFAERHETDAGLVEAHLANSVHRKDWPRRELAQALGAEQAGATLAIWGLAYKEDTHSVKNAPSLALIPALQDCTLRIYDPEVPISVVDHPRATMAPDPLAALDSARALVILTPWQLFKQQSPEAIAARLDGRLLLDPFRVLDPAACRAAGLDYRTLGVAAAA